MTFRTSFNWRNSSQYKESFHVFSTSKEADLYGENRLDQVRELNDYKVILSNKEATHIFADGKVHQIHDNVELWKGILEGVK